MKNVTLSPKPAQQSLLKNEASFFLMFKLTGGVEEIYSEIDRGLKRDHLIEEEI